MGILSTIRNALGLRPPPTPLDPDAPLSVSEAAQAWLQGLPDGQGLHLATTPAADGYVVRVHEGDALGPPPPALAPHPITVSDADLHRLRGLSLHRIDGRWAVVADLDLRSRDTPNPNGRLYLCNRYLVLGRPLFFTSEGSPPWLARDLLAIDGVQSVLLRENTVSVERTPDAPWDQIDRQVDAALRSFFLRCGHPIEASEIERSGDAMEADIWAVLEEHILPGIHADGGDLELVGVQDGVVRVAMHGACRSCPASTATLKMGVERVLHEAFPGQIERVEQV